MPPLQQSVAGADLHRFLHWCSQVARQAHVSAAHGGGQQRHQPVHWPKVCALICRLLLWRLCTAMHWRCSVTALYIQCG